MADYRSIPWRVRRQAEDFLARMVAVVDRLEYLAIERHDLILCNDHNASSDHDKWMTDTLESIDALRARIHVASTTGYVK